MKNVVLLGIIILSELGAYGQGGTVLFRNSSATLINTNALALGGTAGPTATNAGGFYYALFAGPVGVTTATPADLLSSTWTFSGIYGTNTQTIGAGLFTTDGVLGGPATAGFRTLETNSFVIVGWSSNLAGEDWVTVMTKFSSASLSPGDGFWSGGGLTSRCWRLLWPL